MINNIVGSLMYWSIWPLTSYKLTKSTKQKPRKYAGLLVPSAYTV